MTSAPWWREAVIYQIYPRSFADSDGDGVGDIPGIISRLDHLQWLGIDGIWITPINPSPNHDWGYDVSDYCAVHPELGSLDDVDRLIAEGAARGIRVILDLVPNHTSDAHPWFVEARSSAESKHRDWYVWADAGAGGGPPNNWVDHTGRSAWSWDEATQQYYLHNFLPHQPDLNWWNPAVAAAFDEILRFWFDRGVAGFRVDVMHGIIKDAQLRDNPPPQPGDPEDFISRGQRYVYNLNRPETHEVIKRWRRLCDAYPGDRLFYGETYVFDVERVASYYGEGDETHLTFNAPFLRLPFRAGELRAMVADVERLFPEHAWPSWTGSNHDHPRMATRWAGDDAALAKCALLIILGLRGTPILYYGDEIGMPDVDVSPELALDEMGHPPVRPGRDSARTPMQWSPGEGAGFTTPGARPWLPLGDATACSVEAQREDPCSVLHFCRSLIALRRSRPSLRLGAYRDISPGADVWAWQRGEDVICAVNLGDTASQLEIGAGRVALATIDTRMTEAGSLTLAPHHGVVVSLA